MIGLSNYYYLGLHIFETILLHENSSYIIELLLEKENISKIGV